MFGIVLIAALVLIAVLAPLFGADSRIDEAARRRRPGYWRRPDARASL